MTLAKGASSSLDAELSGLSPKFMKFFTDIFRYKPQLRPTAGELLNYRVFDELFQNTLLLPNGKQIPTLIRDGDSLHHSKSDFIDAAIMKQFSFRWENLDEMIFIVLIILFVMIPNFDCASSQYRVQLHNN